ncbi:unnamed protein product [Meloidogyne enterolobii]|uniref:Uncharacterized protein n=1 Tax=Meloidogyne enterolobii TaxID=390850 RepID=A0ACB0XMF9_MELEN
MGKHEKPEKHQNIFLKHQNKHPFLILQKHPEKQQQHLEKQQKHPEKQQKHLEEQQKHPEKQQQHLEKQQKHPEKQQQHLEKQQKHPDKQKHLEKQQKHPEKQQKHLEKQQKHLEKQQKHPEKQQKHPEKQQKHLEKQQDKHPPKQQQQNKHPLKQQKQNNTQKQQQNKHPPKQQQKHPQTYYRCYSKSANNLPLINFTSKIYLLATLFLGTFSCNCKQELISQSVTNIPAPSPAESYQLDLMPSEGVSKSLTFMDLMKQRRYGNNIEQCPCIILPGSNKCVVYDSRYQAALIE